LYTSVVDCAAVPAVYRPIAATLPSAAPAPSARRGAAGAAYAWLRQSILAGALPPGAPLSENEIATRLGVSRTPVREAFIRLEGEGFLAVRPQVGTTVAPIDLDAVADGQFLREAVECRAVQLAAERVTPADVRDLKAQLREQARAVARNDQAGFIALDDRMHQRLVAMGGRPNVWHAVEDVKAQLDRVRFLSLDDPRWLESILGQHEAIVHHVIEGDGTAAVAAMSLHMRAVFASVDAIAREHPEYFRGVPASPAGPAAPDTTTRPARRKR
jgi:DNA-binding GntR family transcriptional regulator